MNKYEKVCSQIKTELAYEIPEKHGPVETFTRALRMSFDDGQLLPSRIAVEERGRKFTIRTQVGKRKCFKCGKSGHVDRNCPDKTETKKSYAAAARRAGAKDLTELDDDGVFH